MAKFLLTLFGGASILIGLILVAIGLLSSLNLIILGWGASMLLAGAPLLGFANALDLLERIAANTQKPGAPGATNPGTGQRVDPAVAEFFERTGRSEVARP